MNRRQKLQLALEALLLHLGHAPNRKQIETMLEGLDNPRTEQEAREWIKANKHKTAPTRDYIYQSRN
jgi:hypothetical protein